MQKDLATTRCSDAEPASPTAPSVVRFTPGPWRECGHARGGCSCGQVWSVPADAPVAKATIGDWGDQWAAIRKVGRRNEAFMEKMVYGHVHEAIGKANARLIAAAPTQDAALNYVADMTYCGVEGLWHLKQGYDPQIVLAALALARGAQ